MNMRFFLFLFFVMLPAAALTQPGYLYSDGPDEMHITLFSHDFASIYEVRSLELERGRNHVILTGLPDAGRITELQLIGDAKLHSSRVVLDPRGMDRIFQTLRGEQVTLKGPAGTVTGTLEDYTLGMLSLRDENGEQLIVADPNRYQVVTASQRVDLREQSGVLLVLEAPETGTYETGLLYLSGSLGWVAEHQLQVDENARRLSWRTLAHTQNNTGAILQNVHLQLFSGNVQTSRIRTGGYQTGSQPRYQRAVPSFTHTFSNAVDLPHGERLQTVLYEAGGIPFEKEYHFTVSAHHTSGERRERPRVHYVIPTGEGSPLNTLLPSGSIRLLNYDSGEPVLIGDTELNEPFEPGSPLSVSGSRASEITMDQTITQTRDVRSRQLSVAADLEVRNTSGEDALIRIFHSADEAFVLDSSSHVPHERTRDHIEFRFTLEAGGTETLHYELSRSN